MQISQHERILNRQFNVLISIEKRFFFLVLLSSLFYILQIITIYLAKSRNLFI